MSKHLLPPNGTDLERGVAEAMTGFEDIPLNLRYVNRPHDCPEKLLPWLAWARSVDFWDADWPEKIKRQVIAESFRVHKHKGTPGAVLRALSAAGYRAELREWWQSGREQISLDQTRLAAHTFEVFLGALASRAQGGDLSKTGQANVYRAIDAAKRYSQHYAIKISVPVRREVSFANVSLAAQRHASRLIPQNGQHKILSIGSVLMGATLLVKTMISAEAYVGENLLLWKGASLQWGGQTMTYGMTGITE